jgi:hypothetical protein
MPTSKQQHPSFIIVGAMKCATSTLYEQLALQPGIFLPELKEPNYFSDNDVYQKGQQWYLSLFRAAPENSIWGEASTHYSKLPDYPKTIERMKKLLPNVKIIYMMRDPLERLVSHYVHQWTMNEMPHPIDHSVNAFDELTNYSLYSMQITPYLKELGHENVLPVFFERFTENPSEELERICQFIGYQNPSNWVQELSVSNQSSQRIRRFPGHDLLIKSRLATFIRRLIIPVSLRNKIKSSLQLDERPVLSPDMQDKLHGIFNQDLAKLGFLLGASIRSESFRKDVLALPTNYSFKSEKLIQ